MRHRGMSRKRGNIEVSQRGVLSLRLTDSVFSSVLCPCRCVYNTILWWVCQGYFVIFLDFFKKDTHILTHIAQKLLIIIYNIIESSIILYNLYIKLCNLNTNKIWRSVFIYSKPTHDYVNRLYVYRFYLINNRCYAVKNSLISVFSSP